MKAAGAGDLRRVAGLVSSGLPVNAIGDKYTGHYPLHAASKNGHLNVVKYLLDKEADTEVRTVGISDRFAFTPLILAAEASHLDIVKILVQRGADVNAHSLINNTALGWAIQKRNREMFEFLFKRGARAEIKDFTLAVRIGDKEMVQWFLDQGFKLDSQEYEYDGSLLCVAISSGIDGNLDMVKFLVEHGANVNRPSGDFGEPPLVQATAGAKWEIGKNLLESGADPNLGARNKYHPLDTAVRRVCIRAEPGSLQFLELLLQRGARPDVVDFKQMTPLEWAVRGKNKEMFLLLVRYGATVPKKLLPTIKRRFGKEVLAGAKIK